jgi:hypothetical protein
MKPDGVSTVSLLTPAEAAHEKNVHKDTDNFLCHGTK